VGGGRHRHVFNGYISWLILASNMPRVGRTRRIHGKSSVVRRFPSFVCLYILFGIWRSLAVKSQNTISWLLIFFHRSHPDIFVGIIKIRKFPSNTTSLLYVTYYILWFLISYHLYVFVHHEKRFQSRKFVRIYVFPWKPESLNGPRPHYRGFTITLI